ncbi:UNVERIFIED_CONTAM: hypothetical protein GTU68_044662 [Idotea baltica]|nr:hypothetical protein [Idotea baltica]
MEGRRTTPSIVGFLDNGDRKIGDAAKRQAITNPVNTISSIKRFMGNRFADVELERKRVSYKVVKGDNDTVRIDINDRMYTPQEISAMVLQKISEAVITVPAYFNDSQRQATKEAGEIAGLKVIKSTNGDTHLGGDDFDQVLIDWLAEEFIKNENIDLRKDPMALQRLKEAEALKDAGLSTSDIDEVILVGGSTRIPKIQEVVEKFFGKKPSKGADSQPSVEIHILQGERPMAAGNKTIGRFHLDGIPPAPRGVPQIEVIFDIDANGILSVSAKDKGTGKEQSIRIEASTGLSEDEIKKMRDEAKANEESDKKAREIADKLNQADSMIFNTEKQMSEYGDKIPADKKQELEDALTELKAAHEAKDEARIDVALESINTKWQAASQDIYAATQAEGQAEQPAADPTANAENSGATADEATANADAAEDVEFEEVDDTQA